MVYVKVLFGFIRGINRDSSVPGMETKLQRHAGELQTYRIFGGIMKSMDYYDEGSIAPDNLLRSDDGASRKIAKGLGWFSIGLGLMEILAPRRLARFMGTTYQPKLMRALGMREITSGVGILSGRGLNTWMWSRVAGDAMDAVFLGGALASGRSNKRKLLPAAAAVAGVVALDVWCSQKLTQSANC